MIAERGDSMAFVDSGATASDAAFEQSECICYLLTIFSGVLQIMVVPHVTIALNDSREPGKESFADHLFGMCIHVCTARELETLFSRIFHTAALSLSSISRQWAKALIMFFPAVLQDGNECQIALFVEAFALVVQSATSSRAILVEIVRARGLFDELKESKVDGIQKGVEIIGQWATTVDSIDETKKENIPKAIAAVGME
jgi:hypothetical protein